MSFCDSLIPHLLIESDLAHGEERLDVVCVTRVLGKCPLHVARLDRLFNSLLSKVLIRLLRDYPVGKTLKTKRLDLG